MLKPLKILCKNMEVYSIAYCIRVYVCQIYILILLLLLYLYSISYHIISYVQYSILYSFSKVV